LLQEWPKSTILSSSQYSNPYTFAGRRLDLVDADSVRV